MESDAEKNKTKNKSSGGRTSAPGGEKLEQLGDAQLPELRIPLPRDFVALARDFASGQPGKSYFGLERSSGGGVSETLAFAIGQDGNLTPLLWTTHSASSSTPPADLAHKIARDVLGREPHPMAYGLLKERLKSRVLERSRYAGFSLGEAEVRAILRDAAAEARTKGTLDCGSEGELLRSWKSKLRSNKLP